MKRILYIFCLGLMLFSCRKEINNLEIEYEYPGIKEYVKTNVAGTILDENDNVIVDANIQIGNQTTKTDVNGIFQIRNLLVDANNLTVTVNKPGYFTGYRTISLSPNSKNYLTIKLLRTNIINTVQANTGGVISYNDYSIELPPNSMVLDNGNSYDGSVLVSSKWLDPTDEEFGNKMPGRLMGLTSQGNLTGLISMGMLAVNLSSSTGELLLLKPGAEAKIRMKVPQSIINQAPSTIPLWYFHPVKKIWVEEGSATLSNGFYEGIVNHFSFWNVDKPVETIKLTFKIHDNNGFPVINAKIKLQVNNSNQISYGYTDNNGEASGLVPKNEILNSEIFLPFGSCAIPVITQQIGPFVDDKIINHILIGSQISQYKLSGKLINCDIEGIKNGYVKINGEINNILWTDDNGFFDNSILLCKPLNNSITLIGYDSQTFKISEEKTALFNANNFVDAGTIIVCEKPTDYIIYTFGGNTYSYIDINLSNTSQNLHVIKSAGVNDININFSFPIPTKLDTFDLTSFKANGKDKAGNVVDHGCLKNLNMCTKILTILSEYKGKGDYISGTFEGMVMDSSNKADVKIIPVSGSYRGKWN